MGTWHVENYITFFFRNKLLQQPLTLLVYCGQPPKYLVYLSCCCLQPTAEVPINYLNCSCSCCSWCYKTFFGGNFPQKWGKSEFVKYVNIITQLWRKSGLFFRNFFRIYAKIISPRNCYMIFLVLSEKPWCCLETKVKQIETKPTIWRILKYKLSIFLKCLLWNIGKLLEALAAALMHYFKDGPTRFRVFRFRNRICLSAGFVPKSTTA